MEKLRIAETQTMHISGFPISNVSNSPFSIPLRSPLKERWEAAALEHPAGGFENIVGQSVARFGRTLVSL